ncbi:MAG: type II toxin-antitoxin system Phd/YefM family antitoxin [Microcystaceae cyanobacterium]
MAFFLVFNRRSPELLGFEVIMGMKFWGLSMNHIRLKESNPTFADLIDRVNQDQQATLITIDEQKQAVLVSLEEWNGLQETLYLSKIWV